MAFVSNEFLQTLANVFLRNPANLVNTQNVEARHRRKYLREALSKLVENIYWFEPEKRRAICTASPLTPHLKEREPTHTAKAAAYRISALMLSQPENLPSVVRRMAAGQMLLDGATPDQVAKQLNLSMATVKRYRAIIDAGGLDALRQMGVGGRTSVLDHQALEWIASALQGSARLQGFESDAWTNARLRSLIEKNYGVKYSRVYIWQIATNLGLGHLLSKSRR